MMMPSCWCSFAALSPTEEVVLAVVIAAIWLLAPAVLILVLTRGERGGRYGAAAWLVLAAVALYVQWREFVDH